MPWHIGPVHWLVASVLSTCSGVTTEALHSPPQTGSAGGFLLCPLPESPRLGLPD
jgi:hypothetical protein